jgi:abortive infection bacteriophage resistance protein
MQKKKLSIPEQIQDMQEKGVTFHLITEEDACSFLKYHNYYFKMKSYEQNYDKYRSTSKKGQYIHLDFAYLQELSILDIYLRKSIISMALDIEHALKTQLLCDLSQNEEEDGYHIVEQYFLGDYRRVKLLYDKINRTVAGELLQKQENEKYALWEIIEVMSFGEFIDLYQLYYSTYPSKEKDYSSYLWSVKFLRNAAAHNNCLLNSLKTAYRAKIHKTKEIQFEISKIKSISPKVREKWMENPVIHDFVVLTFVFMKLIKNHTVKQEGIDNLCWLFNERMVKHKEYFIQNASITESYRFTSKIINYFCNKYRK